MIATGGLLRISRRQDSLHSKTRVESKRQRRARKRKRKNDVVVVKGKLQVCSVSGLVAAVGVLVLLVGIAMAVLGYWPKNKPEYSATWAAKNFQATRGSQPRGSALLMAWNHTGSAKLSQQREVNVTRGNVSVVELVPSPVAPAPLGLVGALLAGWLHSDQLKMFGPLVMGMGIFLFICANAVLHEERDRQTKVIDLRDIYSTVIDAHGLRTKQQSPLNGLVNYIQARSGGMETGARDRAGRSHGSWPSTLWGFGSGGGGSRRPSCARRCSWWRDGSDGVYSVYRDRERGSVSAMGVARGPWETGSIVTSSLNAFTLPVIKLNNCEMEEGVQDTEEQEQKTDQKEEVQEHVRWETRGRRKGAGSSVEEWSPGSKDRSSFPVAIETKAEISWADVSNSQSSLGSTKRWGVTRSSPRWSLSDSGATSQLPPPTASTSAVATSGRKVVGSHLSLTSLSDAAGIRWASSSSRHDDRSRRFSCPRLERSGSKGYIKLADLGGESFEGPDGGTLTPGEEHAGRASVSEVKASSVPSSVVVLVDTEELSHGETGVSTTEHTLSEHTLEEHTPVHTPQQPVTHPHMVIACSPSRLSSAGGTH